MAALRKMPGRSSRLVVAHEDYLRVIPGTGIDEYR
jgi:hypothetical protein